VPLIAAVNGIALGGGCELALACDIRIASSTARFGQPEINLGIIPGWGGTQRLPRLIGATRAMPLLLTGDPIDARTALEWGLVSAVHEPADLLDAARTLAGKIATKAPLAVQATKRAVHSGAAAATIAEALEVERREFVAVFGSEDAKEGVTAFLAKRAPEWTGR
jgi:enoyl-CoA hydratase